MNILVTGSRGVVGTALVRQLKENGHTVFGIDLHHALGEVGFTQEMSHEDFTYSRCDVREYRQLERVFEYHGGLHPFDVVYNCAAEFGRWNGEDYYEKVWETNVIGLRHMLEMQKIYGFKLVQFSSAEVYGDYPDKIYETTMDEVEIRQMNDYALSKWVNEQQILNYQHLNPEGQVVRVRLFDIYGPGEVYHAYRSVCAKFCFHALKGLPITVWKGHIRCGVYIDDTVRALANIATNFKPGKVYNFGSDSPYTIEEMTEMIWHYAGADPTLITWVEEHEMLTTKIKIASSEQAKKDLQFEAKTPLEEGIQKTYEWVKRYELVNRY